MKSSQDTIAAIATPLGRGGIGIVRVSGPEVLSICQHILRFKPKPRFAHFAKFYEATDTVIDEGLALYFPNPHSYTGEDVLELQGHGSPVILDQILKRVTALGARVARPGEFTERAFLNDQLDLAQAEAVADLIDASSNQAARSAIASLQGAFSKAIDQLNQAIIELRVYVEAAMDFPDEEIDFLSEGQVGKRLQALLDQIEMVISQAHQGRLLREGMIVVLVGEPNVGKSSLLNQLTGQDSAIVTNIPGTTRDIIRETIQIDGMPLHVIDTAGLREASDAIEQEGVIRAQSMVDQAHRLLFVTDASRSDAMTIEQFGISELLGVSVDSLPVTLIRNKIDLVSKSPALFKTDSATVIELSAKTGQGIDLLRTHLKTEAGLDDGAEGCFTARRRHLQALDQAKQAVKNAANQLAHFHTGEIVAEELRQAQQALSLITGEFTTDDLLGEIFSSFCIGK